ncbi:hypothetical protein ACIPWF_18530 [Paenarthrobacter sp. NPDC089989]|uniref:hypothetical protein n=1 Tax=unclassified Paenarthrobacter TaxID=2634190 RepID=UPI00381D3101
MATTIWFGAVLSGCDMTFEPDVGQRDSTSEQVIKAAQDGDRQKLLDIALPEMQGREAAADALVVRVGRLDPSSYSVEFREHHGAPDNYIVTAKDADGNIASFELDWNDAKWQLVLGTAGPAKSPAASSSP